MARALGYCGTQKIVNPGVVELWGKRYVWLEDVDGTTYMVGLDDNDMPIFA